MMIYRFILRRMSNVSDKSCREYQNTYFVFNIFFPEGRAIYEIMWNTLVEPDTSEMAI